MPEEDRSTYFDPPKPYEPDPPKRRWSPEFLEYMKRLAAGWNPNLRADKAQAKREEDRRHGS
jgi:hypothetical protein